MNLESSYRNICLQCGNDSEGKILIELSLNGVLNELEIIYKNFTK